MKKVRTAVLASAIALGIGSMASAAVITDVTDDMVFNPGTNGGNLCPSITNECEITVGGVVTPVVFKYDVDEDALEINPFFTTLDGSEFTFSIAGSSGTLIYDPGQGDPILTAIAAKGGSQNNQGGNSIQFGTSFTLNDDGDFVFDISTSLLLNNGDQTPGISNVLGFEGGGTNGVIPLPASALLLLGGIGGLGALRTARRKA